LGGRPPPLGFSDFGSGLLPKPSRIVLGAFLGVEGGFDFGGSCFGGYDFGGLVLFSSLIIYNYTNYSLTIIHYF
jgi:hypothetical protein